MDKILLKILNVICNLIFPRVTSIINRFLNTGEIIDNLRKAHVTQIMKDGDKWSL